MIDPYNITKYNRNQNELEEFRSILDQVERARKSTETSLNESNDRINELTLINANLNNQKRKLENDLMTMQGELNDNLNEFNNIIRHP